MEKRIEKWESLRLEAQKFAPQEYVAACDPEHMYWTINPVSLSDLPGYSGHLYMNSSSCPNSKDVGPIIPSGQAIIIDPDAFPIIEGLLKDPKKWYLEGQHGGGPSEEIYSSISTSSNSYGGHITAQNVGTFRATRCGDNASSNALVVLDAENAIIPPNFLS